MMETSKNIINDAMKVYSTTKHRQINRHSVSLNKIALCFMNGRSINELSYKEDGDVRRKIRRIIEKRVCQSINNQMLAQDGNAVRYRERKQSAKHINRICGRIPYGFLA